MLIQSFLKFLELENVFKTKQKYDGAVATFEISTIQIIQEVFLLEKTEKKIEIDGSPGEG